MLGRLFELPEWNACEVDVDYDLLHDAVAEMEHVENCIPPREMTIPSSWNDRWRLSADGRCLHDQQDSQCLGENNRQSCDPIPFAAFDEPVPSVPKVPHSPPERILVLQQRSR